MQYTLNEITSISVEWGRSHEIFCNVLKIGPVAKSEKLLVHGSMIGLVVELRLDQ